MNSFLGYWGPTKGPLKRAWLRVIGLIIFDGRVWVQYRRGMVSRRGRCLRCGVTAHWDTDRHRLPRTCEGTKRFLIVREIMES